MKLYQKLARLMIARDNCAQSGNDEWRMKHLDLAIELVRNNMPSGSGFNAGTALDYDACKRNRLVLTTSFHHMNDGGFCDGWTIHTITVTPSLAFDFDLRVSGRNRNQIKDYIEEIFSEALNTDIAD
jgi:hypothetical protein